MRMTAPIAFLLLLTAPVAAATDLPDAVDVLQDECLSRMAVIDNLPSPTLAELREAEALLGVWSLLGRYGGSLEKKDLALPVKVLSLVGKATTDTGVMQAADALLAALLDAADSSSLSAAEARDDLADPATRAKVQKKLVKALSILDSIDGSADRGTRAKLVVKGIAAVRKAEALAKKLAG
jgi:hypothetical protein